jgi:hypothetical protein
MLTVLAFSSAWLEEAFPEAAALEDGREAAEETLEDVSFEAAEEEEFSLEGKEEEADFGAEEQAKSRLSRTAGKIRQISFFIKILQS